MAAKKYIQVYVKKNIVLNLWRNFTRFPRFWCLRCAALFSHTHLQIEPQFQVSSTIVNINSVILGVFHINLQVHLN